MKDFAATIKEVYHTERWMLVLMILNLVASIALLAFSITKLNPSMAVVKVGYGDIGGYRDGSWADMIAFPILAVMFGIFHSLVALRIFKKRGAGMTKFFLLTTTTLIAGAFVVLIRLLKEG